MELLQEVESGTSRSETHALIRALADADGETYSHSLQVAAMATAVARRLGFRGEELIDIEFGALLHDIGKLCLPRGLLSKPGRLTGRRARPDPHAPRVGREPGREHPGARARSRRSCASITSAPTGAATRTA